MTGTRSLAAAAALSVALHGGALGALRALRRATSSTPAAVIVDLLVAGVAPIAGRATDPAAREPVQNAPRSRRSGSREASQEVGRQVQLEARRAGDEPDVGAPAAPPLLRVNEVLAPPAPPVVPASPTAVRLVEHEAAAAPATSVMPGAVASAAPSVAVVGTAPGSSSARPAGEAASADPVSAGVAASSVVAVSRTPAGHGVLAGGIEDRSRLGAGAGEGAIEMASLPDALGAAVPPEYEGYVRALRQRIQERLRYPWLAVRQRLQGTVELEVRLDPPGRLATVLVVGGEDAAVLREAAVRAVRDATPFPFPAGAASQPLTIRLPVVFELR